MKNYWDADIEITYNGIGHVLKDLTTEAQERIRAELGRGKVRGPIYDGDIKRGR